LILLFPTLALPKYLGHENLPLRRVHLQRIFGEVH
jgi:hypothetical protein